MKVHLNRIDSARGMARFYLVMVVKSLFDDWEVQRDWGRIGQGGTVRSCTYSTEAEALGMAVAIVKGKVRRGYQVCDSAGS